jgi:hypothetical protein
MTRNLGQWDRGLRLAGAVVAGFCAVQAPLSLPVRLLVFAGMGAYLLLTALAGTCVGYRLLGKSTCRLDQSA